MKINIRKTERKNERERERERGRTKNTEHSVAIEIRTLAAVAVAHDLRVTVPP